MTLAISASSPTIGLWGQFDVDQFDVQVAWRVANHELRRRLPNAVIRSFAPFGSTRPIAVAASDSVSSLGFDNPNAINDIAENLDFAVRLGTIDIHQYQDHPPMSAQAIATATAAFIKPPPQLRIADWNNLCDGASLAPRVWSHALVGQRLSFLQAMHWWPQGGPAVVVDGASTDATVHRIRELTTSFGNATIVVMADVETVETFPTALRSSTILLPLGRSGLHDRITAIANAKLVISDDAAVRAAAQSYGVEAITHQGTPEPLAVPQAIERLDEMFDGFAIAASAQPPQTLIVDAEVAALRRTVAQLQLRLTHERVVFADYVQATRANAEAQIAAARESRTLMDKVVGRLRRSP